jgi:hypothetical protein
VVLIRPAKIFGFRDPSACIRRTNGVGVAENRIAIPNGHGKHSRKTRNQQEGGRHARKSDF